MLHRSFSATPLAIKSTGENPVYFHHKNGQGNLSEVFMKIKSDGLLLFSAGSGHPAMGCNAGF